VRVYDIRPQFIICVLNTLLLFGCKCVSGIALRAYYVDIDHCDLLILLVIECNARPSSATIFVSRCTTFTIAAHAVPPVLNDVFLNLTFVVLHYTRAAPKEFSS
jgi:hypothetical protein